MLLKLKQFFFKLKYWRKPPEMVRYWKSQTSVKAKQTVAKEGHTIMWMQGEDYPMEGNPRGVLLYGPLSPLKHIIKNRIFNATWDNLENGLPDQIIWNDVRIGLDEIFKLLEDNKYDLVPYHALSPSVKEIYRAMTVVEKKIGGRTKGLKELICFIMQIDDSYKYRVQWLMKFFNPKSFWRKIFRRNPVDDLDFALSMLEHGEVVSDMKERERLLRRVVMFLLKDKQIRQCFDLLIEELDFKKLRLSKADKYFFRAKYFKVDYPEYNY